MNYTGLVLMFELTLGKVYWQLKAREYEKESDTNQPTYHTKDFPDFFEAQ